MPALAHGAMVRMIEIWRRVTATRYTRALEAEVARLRAENRALLNSILGIAGVPPITVETARVEGITAVAVGAADSDDTTKRDPSSLRLLGMKTNGERAGETPALRKAKAGVGGTPALQTRVPVASPMRRRSWQQINRALEFASARKKERPGTEPGAEDFRSAARSGL